MITTLRNDKDFVAAARFLGAELVIPRLVQHEPRGTSGASSCAAAAKTHLGVENRISMLNVEVGILEVESVLPSSDSMDILMDILSQINCVTGQ